MSDEKPMGQVIQIDEAGIRDHLGEMVRVRSWTAVLDCMGRWRRQLRIAASVTWHGAKTQHSSNTNLGLSVTSTTCAGRPSRCEPSLLGEPKEHPKRIGSHSQGRCTWP